MPAARIITLTAGAAAFVLAVVALVLIHADSRTWNVPLMVLALVGLIVVGLSLRGDTST